MKGLVVIPAYNEAPTIRGVLERLRPVLPAEAEILVVDDGAKDATASEARASGCARVVRLPCNLGYANALRTGLMYGLRGDYAWFAFMDADGQHRPEDMAGLIRAFSGGGADLIIGSRWQHQDIQKAAVPTGRRIGMVFFAWLTRKLTGRRLTDTTSGMKIMNRAVAGELLAHHFGDFHSEILIYLHDRRYRLEEFPIVVHERQAGSSMYSLRDAILYPWRNLILIAIFKLNSWLMGRVR